MPFMSNYVYPYPIWHSYYPAGSPPHKLYATFPFTIPSTPCLHFPQSVLSPISGLPLIFFLLLDLYTVILSSSISSIHPNHLSNAFVIFKLCPFSVTSHFLTPSILILSTILTSNPALKISISKDLTSYNPTKSNTTTSMS